MLPRECVFPGGCMLPWGCMLPGGVHASREKGCMTPGGTCFPGGGISACTKADPPVNRITDTSKNITLATASFQMIGKDRG